MNRARTGAALSCRAGFKLMALDIINYQRSNTAQQKNIADPFHPTVLFAVVVDILFDSGGRGGRSGLVKRGSCGLCAGLVLRDLLGRVRFGLLFGAAGRLFVRLRLIVDIRSIGFFSSVRRLGFLLSRRFGRLVRTSVRCGSFCRRFCRV